MCVSDSGFEYVRVYHRMESPFSFYLEDKDKQFVSVCVRLRCNKVKEKTIVSIHDLESVNP